VNRTLFVNQDDAHFTMCHPHEDMSVEGCRRLVDFYATDTQVAGLLFCTNLQRALFDSKAWQTLYDGYDPDAGPDQPFLKWLGPAERELTRGDHGRFWVHNAWLLAHRKVDHLAVWLQRCRHHGIEAWLTMRMNDAHGLDAYQKRLDGTGDYDGWCMLNPCDFWIEHPELHRAPYRWECGNEGAFDYAKRESREHHLNLIGELFERFDPDGLELDWLRWGLHFAPGHERAGREHLTGFVREVRRLADACARRVGHPVMLAHRVPAQPESCLELGSDVITWAREGLADQLTLSSMLGSANFAYPMEIWRAMVGPKVRLLAHAEACSQPYPEQKALTYELMYGVAASALHRGADGIYLFNECYRESDAPELLQHVLTHAGDLETLSRVNRRQAVTFPQVHAGGEPRRNVLPIPLRLPKFGADFGRLEENITLRIAVGPRPAAGRAVLRLAFSSEVPKTIGSELEVRVNTHGVAPAEPFVLESVSRDAAQRVGHWPGEFPESVAHVCDYDVPLGMLHDDVNAVEFMPPQIDGTVEWAEILILVEGND